MQKSVRHQKKVSVELGILMRQLCVRQRKHKKRRRRPNNIRYQETLLPMSMLCKCRLVLKQRANLIDPLRPMVMVHKTRPVPPSNQRVESALSLTLKSIQSW